VRLTILLLTISSVLGNFPFEQAARAVGFEKIVAGDGLSNDLYGGSLALDGDTLVVGSKWHMNSSGQGAAYIYQRTAGHWDFVTELPPVGGQGDRHFGNAVGIDSTTIIVGDYQRDGASIREAGAAYVFNKSPSGWSQTAKLIANDPTIDSQFGAAVDIRGNSALVGNGGPAGAYIFELDGGSWVQRQKLLPSFPDAFGQDGSFGQGVALGDGFALVAASSQDTGSQNSGAVFAYKKTPTGYVETDVMTAPTAVFRGSFGASIDVSGDTVLIGSPGSVPTATPQPGAAYIFERNGDDWVQTAKLQASDKANLDFFGSQVALSGNFAAVAASGQSQGKVYLFEKANGVWNEIAQLTSGQSQSTDNFGVTLALDGTRLAIGAPADDQAASNAGAVYSLSVPEPGCVVLLFCGAQLCWVNARLRRVPSP
jgi:hypothetical protein